MSASEGFRRVRMLLKVLVAMWIVIAVWICVYAARKATAPIDDRDIVAFVLLIGLPPAFVWVVFWIIEGFFISRDDP
jgi:hypothetical protein